MDEHPVTAAEFRRFVRRDGVRDGRRAAARPGGVPGRRSRTCSSRARSSSGARAGPVNLDDYRNWWEYVPGAHWRRPGRQGHDDQRARPPPGRRTSPTRTPRRTRPGPARSCRPRRSGSSPRAAGLEGAVFAWGDEHFPDGKAMANTLAGRVPLAEPQARRLRGHVAGRQLPAERLRPLRHRPGTSGSGRPTGTSPVIPTRSPARAASRRTRASPSPDESYNAGQPGEHIPRRVIKGGSHLCAPNYCLRYRPAARQPQMIDTSMAHLGFRCIVARSTHSSERSEHLMADKPNILVIWGDDIGITNLSCYSDGLMGYRTPNIDRIANEGMRFTDSYGEQSCTAGRVVVHHGAERLPHRAQQGRPARRRRSACRRRTRRSPSSSRTTATRPGSSARTISVTRTSSCRPSTGSTSSSATSTT